jgi:hypothetical protein
MHHCRTKRADHVVLLYTVTVKAPTSYIHIFAFFSFPPFSTSDYMEMDLTLFQQQRPHQQTQQKQKQKQKQQQQQHFVIDDDKTTKKRIDSAIAMKSNNQLLYISLEYPLDHIYLPGEQITGK